MDNKIESIVTAIKAAEMNIETTTNDRINAMAGSHGTLNIGILKLIDYVVEEVKKGLDITLSFKNSKSIELDRIIKSMISKADSFGMDRANAAFMSAVILYFAGTDPRTGVPAGNRKLGALCRIAAGVPRGGVANIPTPKLGNKISGFAAVSAIYTKLQNRELTKVDGRNIPFGAIGTLYMHSVLGEDIVLPEIIKEGTTTAVNAMITAMRGAGMMMCHGMSDRISAAIIGSAAILEIIHPDANTLFEEGLYLASSHMVGRIAAKTAGLPEKIHMSISGKVFETGDLIGDMAVLLKDSGAVTVVCMLNFVDLFSMFDEWLTWTGGPTITPLASLGGEAWIAMNLLLEGEKDLDEVTEIMYNIRDSWIDPEISKIALNIIATKALESSPSPVSKILKNVTEGAKTYMLYRRANEAFTMFNTGNKIDQIVTHFENERKFIVEKNSGIFCSKYYEKDIKIKLLKVAPLGRIAEKGVGLGKYWAIDPDVNVLVEVDGKEFILEQLCQYWIPKVALMEAEEYRIAVESASIFIQDLSYSGLLLFNITVPVCIGVALGIDKPNKLAKMASDAAYLTGGIPGSRQKATLAGKTVYHIQQAFKVSDECKASL